MNYRKAASLENALDLLTQSESANLILAGGTDIMVKYNKTPFENDLTLVYIGDIKELKTITESDDEIRIGCLATATQIAECKIIMKYAPALQEAAYSSAGPQVRNLATIGGNIGTASPAGDMISALIALKADVIVMSKHRVERKTMEEIIVGTKKSSLKRDQMITEIIIPKDRNGSAFEKMGKRKAMSVSFANAACSLILNPSNIVEDIRIVAGSVAPTAIRVINVENALIGTVANLSDIHEKAALSKTAVSPITDQRATMWYRTEIIPILIEKAVSRAILMARETLKRQEGFA